MLAKGAPDLSMGFLFSCLQTARTLFEQSWLDQQWKLEPSDPILNHLRPPRAPKQIGNAIRDGISGGMHPLAEAILVGIEAVKQFEQTGKIVGSMALYRVVSLGQIATRCSGIANIADRVQRLTANNWRATLYELLTAIAYAAHHHVTVIPEEDDPKPDLHVDLPVAPIHVECKAKLQYEEAVVDFVRQLRRDALQKISRYLAQVDAGFVIKIEVSDHAATSQLPQTIEQMVSQGKKHLDIRGASVNIVPYDPTPHTLPERMSFYSAQLWEHLFQFGEWRDWHYILPSGNCQVQNLSNLIVTAVERPCLVCVRSTALRDSAQDIRQTLKGACRRQLRGCKPAVIHMLVNTQLYAIGDRCRRASVEGDLTTIGEDVLRQYSRLSAIVYDLVDPPSPGSLHIGYSRLVLPRRCGSAISS